MVVRRSQVSDAELMARMADLKSTLVRRKSVLTLSRVAQAGHWAIFISVLHGFNRLSPVHGRVAMSVCVRERTQSQPRSRMWT